MYANVLGKPVLAPDGVPTSLGSGIFALLAAAYSNPSSKRSRRFVCLSRPIRPNPRPFRIYKEQFRLYREVYFAFGKRESTAVAMGEILPELRRIAAGSRSTLQEKFLAATS
jgi:L-ribulokinase